MENSSWLKLNRKIFDSDLWLADKFTKGQAWVDLFGNANHCSNSFWVRGNEVKIIRGQIGWSEITMSKRWRWSKNKVRRFLKWLETEQQIEQQKTTITSIITILNYDKYQSQNKETEQQMIQQKDSRRYTNKNDKNDKNDKNEYIAEAAKWDFKKYLEGMEDNKRRDLPIIALYWKFKKFAFTNKKQAEVEIKRSLRAAKNLEPFEDEKIWKTMDWLSKNADYAWKLETVGKFINEKLSDLKIKR